MAGLSIFSFDEIYRQYAPMVFRRCKFILKDEDKACDAMQDVFVKVFERKNQLDKICASYLYVAATRVCLNKIRFEKFRTGPDFDVISQVVEDGKACLEEEKLLVRELLDSIFEQRDEKDKKIATLHYVENYTLEETAEKVGMSVSGVRKRLSLLSKYAKKFM